MLTSLSLLPLGTAVASPAATTTSPAIVVGQWAYGAFQQVNLSGQTSNGTYTIHAAFGWHVVLTATNTSATTYQVELVRTAAATINATFCSPNCNSALVTATLGDHVWETITAFSNFTTAAAVNTSSGTVAAMGITNSSAALAGNVTERMDVQTSSLLHSRSSSSYFTAAATAADQVAFTPALGLIPQNLTNGTTWSSAAQFTAAGSWNVSAFWSHTLANGTSEHASASSGGAVNGSGEVGLQGSYGAHVRLADQLDLPAIVLHLHGPFDLIEGTMLVPAGADILGGSTGDWSSSRNGPQSASTAGVEFAAQGAGQYRVLASSTNYNAGTASDLVASTQVQVAGLSPLAPPLPGPSTGAIIQAQPESVSSAQSGADCLLSPTGCAAGGTTPVRFAGAGGLIALAAVIGLAALLIGLVAGRRRVPPAPRPNASLYPPGAALAPFPPVRAAPGTTPPASPEAPTDDPLEHLW